MSNSSVAVTLEVVREAVQRARKEMKTTRTLNDVKEVTIAEQKIPQGQTGVEVKFGSVLNADAVIVFTPKKVGLHFNGAANPEITCGSYMVLLDTQITSLHVDNDIVTEDVTVEVWLVALTD